jgi:hypothetical protein
MDKPSFNRLPDATNDQNNYLRTLLGGCSETSLRTAALLALYEFNESAAIPEVFAMLEKGFRVERWSGAKAIALLFSNLSAAGEDRLRDLLMELCLNPGKSFLVYPKNCRDPSSEQKAASMSGEILAPQAAWNRLDPSAAEQWLSSVAALLASWPKADVVRVPRRKLMSFVPGASPGSADWLRTDPFSNLRLRTVLFCSQRCLRHAPVAFRQFHPLLTEDSVPWISLQVIALLTEVTTPRWSSPAPPENPLGLPGPAQPTGLPPAILPRIPAYDRQLVVTRLIDLTQHSDQEIIEGAVEELERTGRVWLDERGNLRLIELLSSGVPEARQKAAHALVAINTNTMRAPIAQALIAILLEWRRSAPESHFPQPSAMPSDIDQRFDRLLQELSAQTEAEAHELPQAVRMESEGAGSYRSPPRSPDAKLGAAMASLTELVITLESTARRSADELLAKRCLEMLKHELASVRWCGLWIAGAIGAEQLPAPVELLLAPVAALLDDGEESVQEQAKDCMAALKNVAELNYELAAVADKLRSVGSYPDPGAKEEHARRVAAILARGAFPPSVPGKTKTAFHAATNRTGLIAAAQSSSPRGNESVPDEALEDSKSILAALQDPQRRRLGSASLAELQAGEFPLSDLPALARLVFGPDAVEETFIIPFLSQLLIEESGTREAAEIVEKIPHSLASPIPVVRENALAALRHLGVWADMLIPALVAMTSANDPVQREFGIRGLTSYPASIVSKKLAGPLPALLIDPSVAVRRAAVQAISYLGEDAYSPNVVATLRSLLEDAQIIFENRVFYGSDRIRIDALKALGALGPRAFDAARYTLLNQILDPDPETQGAATKAALAMGPEARQYIVRALVSVAR